MASSEYLVRLASERDLRSVPEIHVASWQDAYQGVVPDNVLLGLSVAGSLPGWQSTLAKYPANITVACSRDHEICGFCCAGPVVDAIKNAPFEFEIYGLHVTPGRRRQGIGARLLHDALARAKHSEGMNSAIVWTFEALRLARKFYEREGGKPVKSGVLPLGGVTLAEVAYGWTSLGSFGQIH